MASSIQEEHPKNRKAFPMVMERHLQYQKGFTPRRRRKMNFTQRAQRKGAKNAERVMEEWSVKDGKRTELIGMMWTAAG
jgi:hypothetical protein